MEIELKRRVIGALFAALIVTGAGLSTARLTVELSLLTFQLFSAMCALFLGMALIHWYRKTRERSLLVLYGTTVIVFIGAMVAFELSRDDLFPAPRDLQTVREIGTGAAVAITWGLLAAWLLEAGMKNQYRLDRQ